MQGYPPIHSIIIPHRDRLKRLILCIWSIQRSARICGITDYEIIVSDQHSRVPVPAALRYVADDMTRIRILFDTSPVPTAETPDGEVEVFSKPLAINLGIEASQGDVLTFLDADAIVGARWMEGGDGLSKGWWADTTRLCYRVRYLPEEIGDQKPGPNTDSAVSELFRRYTEYPKAHEGYASPEIPATGCWDPNLTFGNSQFSIRRSDLGEVRCDERFKSAGHEDLAFIWLIWQHAGISYKGTLRKRAKDAMFHIHNDREPIWDNTFLYHQNREMYKAMVNPPPPPVPNVNALNESE